MTPGRRSLLAGAIAAAALSLGVCAGGAAAAGNDEITIGSLALATNKLGYDLLVANFERAYPSIKVDVTYGATTPQLFQLETTELAAGNAPELLMTLPGCGAPIAVCTLAKAGHLAPMIQKPWAKRSLPLVTSMDKYGQGLFAFTPVLAPFGIFTNDDRFEQLGLKIPQTFAQLLDVCRKAAAAGTPAVLLAGAATQDLLFLIVDLAVATVYGKDPHWAAKLRAGTVTFDGAPGWHQALQEFIDMNAAGCFQPGAAGTTTVIGQFAQGQGLMLPFLTTNKGAIDEAHPTFSYSHHPFAGATEPGRTTTFVNVNTSPGVNAHSSVKGQAAAQTFVDFIARPKQTALYARSVGGLTQYEFLKGQIPDFMSDFATVFEKHRYVMNPIMSWWNANVSLELRQDAIGLITGQRSIDDILNAMDAAWKQGPS